MKKTDYPVSYSIHDRKTVHRMIVEMFKYSKDVTAGGLLQEPLDLYLARADRRYAKFLGTHRYVPHQGKRETERRRRQMELE